jgi:hypothetical protein
MRAQVGDGKVVSCTLPADVLDAQTAVAVHPGSYEEVLAEFGTVKQRPCRVRSE